MYSPAHVDLACLGLRLPLPARVRPARIAAVLLTLVFAAVQAHAAEPVISTVAGGGDVINMDGVGDGGPATQAYLSWPRGVAADAAGNFYIADTLNFRVRKVSQAGTITTIAGKQGDGIGNGDFNGDGIPATEAELSAWGVDVDAAGNVYIADKQNARIRRVSTAGIITTVAGNGIAGFAGDGGSAILARLNQPDDIAVDAAGNLYLLDQGNQRVRKVSAGIISTVAGNGQAGFSGDGGQARTASLNNPQSIAVDALGNLYIADTGNDRVRLVSADGKIQTIAGGGPFRVDALASNSILEDPLGVAVDRAGNVYISEARNAVRMIGTDGVMRTVAGIFDDVSGFYSSNPGILGDDGPATAASFETAEDLVVDRTGNLLVADRGNGRIRKVTPIPNRPTPPGLGAFRPYVLTRVNGPLRDVISGDITGDGRDDVIMTTRLGRFGPDPGVDWDLIIMVQKADGTLAAPVRLDYPAAGYQEISNWGGKLALGDFNRDGIQDVVVSHETGLDLVAGSRSGTFVVRSFNGPVKPEPAMDIVAMDVDRDGNLDVVCQAITTVWSGNMGVRTYFGTGTGGVRAFLDNDRKKVVEDLVTADFNGDGVKDLGYLYQGISDVDDHGVELFLQSTTGGFSPVAVYPFGTSYMTTLAAADFNGDLRADLAFSQSIQEEGVTRAALGIVAQGMSGQLQAVERRRTYSYASDFEAIRRVHDPRSGLVALYPDDDAIGFFPQTGSGLGAESKYHVPGLVPEEWPSIATGDVNHDGLSDVLVAIPGTGLAVLYGTAKRLPGSQPRVRGRGVQGGVAVSAGPTLSPRVRPRIADPASRTDGIAQTIRQGLQGYVETAARVIDLAGRQLSPARRLDSVRRWLSRSSLPWIGKPAQADAPQQDAPPSARHGTGDARMKDKRQPVTRSKREPTLER